MKPNKTKYYYPKLEKNGGCEGCNKKCLYNAEVAHPDIAKLTKGHKFECNSSRRK